MSTDTGKTPQATKAQRDILSALAGGMRIAFTNDGKGVGYYLRGMGSKNVQPNSKKLGDKTFSTLMERGWIEQEESEARWVLEVWGISGRGHNALAGKAE